MTTKAQMKKKERVVLSVHTQKDTSARLESLAEAAHSTKSALVNQAIESFLNHQEWVVAEIEKGMDDINAGEVIAQSDMKAWAASLRKASV